MKRILKYFIFAVVLNFIFVRSSSAYIDPGSGSYFIQILIATLFGVGFTLKSYWLRIVEMLKSLFHFKKQ